MGVAGGVVGDLMLLGARLYAGITIAKAGFDKLPTPDWMVEQVGQIGFIPAPGVMATLACATEFVAGVLLALGLFGRATAAVLAVTMGVASFGYHKLMPLVDMHIAQGFFWLFVALVAAGPGRFSLDRVVGGLWERRRPVAVLLGVLPAAALVGLAVWLETGERPAPADEADIEAVQLAGSFNGWSLEATPMERGEGARWTAEVRVGAPGVLRFKFVGDGDWGKAIGASERGVRVLPAEGRGDPKGDDIQVDVPAAGVYRWTVDASDRAWRVEAVEGAAGTPAP
jgi:putative oxidoreductase